MEKITTQGSVTRQLQIVFAISILILLVSSYASYYSNRRLIDSSLLVDHTNEVIVEAEKLISQTKDAETGQRGYLLTNNPIFLEKFDGSYEDVLVTHQHLVQLTSDNPVQQQNLMKAKMLIDSRFQHMRKLLDVAASVQPEQRREYFRVQNDDILKGKYIMDDLRAVVDKIKEEESALLKIRTETQETFITYTPIMVIVAALLAILISVVAYLRIKSDLDERQRKQEEEQRQYEETTNRINELENVTQRISQGEFDVRSKDTGDDNIGKIGLALNHMAASLGNTFTELENKNWLQQGAMELSNAVRKERLVKNVSDAIVSTIAAYIDAPVGTLYIKKEDDSLRLAGNYAASQAPRYLQPGEGLTAQAAMGKKIIVTEELPADYLKISSSTGSTNPVYLIIMPLVYHDSVMGVMEIGLLSKPEPLDIAFLESSAEAIAIALNTAHNYERIQDLLEETQTQAEELQAQHEELENINTELEAQAEKLQASEEELKVQQEELQEANSELEERARLLEEKNQEIVEKNMIVQQKAEELALSTKYKSEFLANMSHELRTPLNSILLLSRLLNENNDNNLTTDQVEYARVIQNSGYGLLTLIDEILDLSKIEAGKMDLEYTQVSISEIEENSRNLFEPVAHEKNLQLRIAIHKDVPAAIETDKLRLEQVIRNLLSNALKFTSEGSVTLDIAMADKEHICFEVRDTGIGIPEDKQKLIFEAFQQADGSTRRKYGGTGLGLSISRELVKLLGGRIELKSIPGKGSSFYVFIPVAKEFAVRQPELLTPANIEIPVMEGIIPETMPHKPNGKYISPSIPENIPDDRAVIAPGDKNILIIEDDTNFAKSLLEFTRKQGYKGIVAVRGDEGIELAAEYNPTGILLDLQLPVKSGWQVMDELKANPATRHIPVHIMSSFNAKKEVLLKGAIDFVNKPMAYEQMQEIFDKIELVLNRKSKKVLIIEENPKHAKALSYFLDSFNINSDIKNSIQESIDALKNNVDCVILDMGVPDQNAYDTLEKIKSREGLEHLPIIVFTGKSLSLSDEQKIKKYADSIVVKTAHSYKRLLDEISLFLHLVEDGKQKAADGQNKKFKALNEVLRDKTVLVVDDDVRNIFSLTKSLEAMQMNIVTAVNGKEAMQKLAESKKVDVVLLDMMMPEMDGYETARRIRASNAWKKLPIIAVTAKAMTGDREKCIQAGASDYISKPVDIDQLISLLRVWLYDKG